MDTPETGERLSGGNMSAVVRVSNHGASHVGAMDSDRAPSPRAPSAAWDRLDAMATAAWTLRVEKCLTYLPGTVPRYPFPTWVWEDSVLHAAAKRSWPHSTMKPSASLSAGDVWRLSTHAPAEVICHNDFAPYNFVFDDARDALWRHRLGYGITRPARVGPRTTSHAVLSRSPRPTNADSLPSDVPERRRRLHLLCRAYGRVIDSGQRAGDRC
ncbi:MAG: hypothetical protein WKF83_15375 [Nocardioidaceae bacterium]